MDSEYNFIVDKKMFVKSWDELITELTGESASIAAGKKYYEVFPRLIYRDKDAVAFSIEKQRKLVLKGYIFHFLFYRVTADIMIKPVLTAKGIQGAAIKVSNVSMGNGYSPKGIQKFIAMGKTASTLAHSIRNPLNALHGAVTIISQKCVPDTTLREFALIMQEEISRIDNFIAKFLSNSISGIKPSVADINFSLKRIQIMTSFQTHARNIRADFRYGIIPKALINSFQLEQAVLNIINNALEAIGSDGGLTVHAALDTSSARDFIVIDVSDDGPGMPTKNSVAVTRGKKGKGFGLIITEDIMKLYGGRMEIHSTKGRGTSVKLYIPANTVGGTDE